MRIGDTVVAKRDNRLLGEIIAIDDWDRATVKLNESGAEALIHICDLMIITEGELDGLYFSGSW